MNLFKNILSFGEKECGVSTTEFALILPVLVAMFFGIIETGDAVSAKGRLENATNTFVDLLTQEEDLTPIMISDLSVGIARIAQIETSNLAYTITSAVYDPSDDRVEVAWSIDQNGGSPNAEGDPIHGTDEDTIRQTMASLIIVEVEYNYSSNVSSFLVGELAFRSISSRLPRYTNSIRLCPTLATCS
ncbi:MAG: pilus assembly protein [Aquisalinus sp.]|nr:pilus assembly protein [Aquisalinus sp.]